MRNILKDNGILNVYQNYDFKVCLTMHKAVNGQLPDPLKKLKTAIFSSKTVELNKLAKVFRIQHQWFGMNFQVS